MVNAEPGTGTQYYTEACVAWEEHPRISEAVEEQYDDPQKQRLSATQYTLNGRTWQCGGDYWDTELEDLVTLEAVVRKSSWCDTRDAEDGTLKLQFNAEHHGSFEVDPASHAIKEGEDLHKRFLPRHNVPFTLP